MARLARSLATLRNEIRELYPHRDTSSDGWLGDGAHANRQSKHNPGPDGIVEALDIDEDIDGKDDIAGRELWTLVQHLLKLARAGHPALGPGAHFIYEGRIWSKNRDWEERQYTGANAHRRHLHVACSDGAGKDSVRTWKLSELKNNPPPAPKPDRWLGLTNPPMQGQDVLNVQRALNKAGNDLIEDGIYGRATADLIAVFQKNRGITERGCGPQTWAALRKVAHG